MRCVRMTKSVSVVAMLVLMAGLAAGQNKHCTAAGGMLMTNLGAVDPATTMGTATGDLKGAVGATILSTEGSGNTLILHVQHHWVTESGDTLDFSNATLTSTQVAPGLYAVVAYPTHLKGGTGKFVGATGDFNSIGEADLVNGRIVVRYFGRICFASGD
jgi:hypothetical protein